jgi:predicted ATP-dependent endonuclease of OLD family
MKLISAHIKEYKSIDDSELVPVEPKVTVLVGQNESGKTAFLQAIYKTLPSESNIKYDVTEEYPRKNLNNYEREHKENPATVAILEFKVDEDERNSINEEFGYELLNKDFPFSISFKYDGSKTISLDLPQIEYIQYIIKEGGFSSDVTEQIKNIKSVRELFEKISGMDLNSENADSLATLKKKFDKAIASNWTNILQHVVYHQYLVPLLPKFLYFDDYYILPGKINLPDLHKKTTSNNLSYEDKTALSLLEMAGVELNDLINAAGYEKIKAKLESISNSITDKVFEYWRQNQDLDVEFDIRSDPTDGPPYNNGNNLYIRIKNRRHRVTVPFNQRSKGFIWFFSFIVWFDSIQRQIGTNKDLILLLDEPGLSLHALAQADFLNYISDLSKSHQIIYTTHSPFMVPSEGLNRVRMVEDKNKQGTKITSNVSNSDPKTVFPLQAALGYSIAQNLFISKRNLLVEGPADLIYLKFFSTVLELLNKATLRNDITIVPVGGLDKLATFVALLGANELELVVLHDSDNKTDSRLDSLVQNKIIKGKFVINYGLFRDQTKGNSTIVPSDVEDMMSSGLYLSLFNGAYKQQLGEVELIESELPEGNRITERIGRLLVSKGIQLKQNGGYNHYLVSNYLASNPIKASMIDSNTLERFEKLFVSVNKLFSEEDSAMLGA